MIQFAHQEGIRKSGAVVKKDKEVSRVILLDRDGVINEAVRNGYVLEVDGLRLLPGSSAAIVQLERAGFTIVVVSNQQCVGKGLLSAEGLDLITEALREQIIESSGGRVADFFYCPHLAAQNCACRKPKPGLLLQAQKRYGFDLRETFFVGDTYGDVETAHRAGCRSIFVLSGLDAQRYRDGEAFPTLPEHVAEDLQGAVRHVLAGVGARVPGE